jgi:hypothetical protein
MDEAPFQKPATSTFTKPWSSIIYAYLFIRILCGGCWPQKEPPSMKTTKAVRKIHAKLQRDGQKAISQNLFGTHHDSQKKFRVGHATRTSAVFITRQRQTRNWLRA